MTQGITFPRVCLGAHQMQRIVEDGEEEILYEHHA